MDGQSISVNQAFRDRIRGYMKGILIFNGCKLASAIGALVAAIFIKINLDNTAVIPGVPSVLGSIINPVYYVLPIIGAIVVSYLTNNHQTCQIDKVEITV